MRNGVSGNLVRVLTRTAARRILTTLLNPGAGEATVAGVDVLKHPGQARIVIGLSGQYATVDEILTGREYLLMFGQLYRLPKKIAASRAYELLEQFGLSHAGDKVLKTLSRRRSSKICKRHWMRYPLSMRTSRSPFPKVPDI